MRDQYSNKGFYSNFTFTLPKLFMLWGSSLIFLGIYFNSNTICPTVSLKISINAIGTMIRQSFATWRSSSPNQFVPEMLVLCLVRPALFVKHYCLLIVSKNSFQRFDWSISTIFHQIWNCHTQSISVFKSLKFVIWERVNSPWKSY